MAVNSFLPKVIIYDPSGNIVSQIESKQLTGDTSGDLAGIPILVKQSTGGSPPYELRVPRVDNSDYLIVSQAAPWSIEFNGTQNVNVSNIPSVNLNNVDSLFIGQQAMVDSMPVVLASNQSSIPVDTELPAAAALADDESATPTVPRVGALLMGMDNAGGSNIDRARLATLFDGDSGAGTQLVAGVILRKAASGGSVEFGTNANPIRIDPTGATIQGVQGDPTVGNPPVVIGGVDNAGAPSVINPAVVNSSGALSIGSTTTNPVFVAGTQASGAADTAGSANNAVKIGGVARTANPTAVTNAQNVKAMFDDVGRLVVAPGHVRDLVTKAYVALAGTSETTILAAGGAGVFHDVVALTIGNRNATAVDVIIREATAGGTVWRISLPGNSSHSVPISVPVPQAAANANWTAQSTSADVDVTIEAIKNV